MIKKRKKETTVLGRCSFYLLVKVCLGTGTDIDIISDFTDKKLLMEESCGKNTSAIQIVAWAYLRKSNLTAIKK